MHCSLFNAIIISLLTSKYWTDQLTVIWLLMTLDMSATLGCSPSSVMCSAYSLSPNVRHTRVGTFSLCSLFSHFLADWVWTFLHNTWSHHQTCRSCRYLPNVCTCEKHLVLTRGTNLIMNTRCVCVCLLSSITALLDHNYTLLLWC